MDEKKEKKSNNETKEGRTKKTGTAEPPKTAEAPKEPTQTPPSAFQQSKECPDKKCKCLCNIVCALTITIAISVAIQCSISIILCENQSKLLYVFVLGIALIALLAIIIICVTYLYSKIIKDCCTSKDETSSILNEAYDRIFRQNYSCECKCWEKNNTNPNYHYKIVKKTIRMGNPSDTKNTSNENTQQQASTNINNGEIKGKESTASTNIQNNENH